jgi:2-polyprenyl-6-methoxyphenol hydroxylase-like FAD-dependent oxidoreductase
MKEQRTAIVVGGGIAGPVAAMALRRAGVEARVYEGYEHAADGVGAALMVAPNGLGALGLLGIDERLGGIGIPSPRMVVRSGSGKQLAEFRDLPGLPVAQTVSRADLHRVLAAQAAERGVEIEYGKRFVSAEESGDGIAAVFADGSRAEADFLIGADGIGSVVRGHVDPAAKGPEYGELCGFGSWLADSGLEPTGGAYQMTFGRHGFFAYLVAEDGRTLWFASIAHDRGLSIAEAEEIPARRWLDEMRETFAEDRCPALEILDQVRPEDLMTTGTQLRLPTPSHWHRGRALIIGDAAHAASSSSGQGASMAIESAIEMAISMQREATVEAAFERYENVRRPRVEKVIAYGRRTESRKAPGPVGRVLRDLLMPVAMKAFAKPEKMRWLTAHRIEWEQAPAAELV